MLDGRKHMQTGSLHDPGLRVSLLPHTWRRPRYTPLNPHSHGGRSISQPSPYHVSAPGFFGVLTLRAEAWFKPGLLNCGLTSSISRRCKLLGA